LNESSWILEHKLKVHTIHFDRRCATAGFPIKVSGIRDSVKNEVKNEVKSGGDAGSVLDMGEDGKTTDKPGSDRLQVGLGIGLDRNETRYPGQ
jgi:hypothetical protein